MKIKSIKKKVFFPNKTFCLHMSYSKVEILLIIRLKWDEEWKRIARYGRNANVNKQWFVHFLLRIWIEDS
jgi:hypothetical protein